MSGRRTVVIGAGMAGMVAALRLAGAGCRTVVVARGAGCTQLSGGTVDVLGYAPERVESPAGALAGFARSNPGHPYARVGAAGVAAGLGWLRASPVLAGYEGDLAENRLLPTAVGAPRPACLVPSSMAPGDLRRGGRFVLVGPVQLRDFHAPLAAANLSALPGVEARAVALELPTTEADLNALAVARRLDAPDFRAEVLRRLAGVAEPGEAVGFPAVLGLSDAPACRSEFEDHLGAPVFEIPTPPPSVPGMRLAAALGGAVRRAGAATVAGASVVGADTDGDRVTAVRVLASGGTRTWPVEDVVLASGGWLAGGLEMDSYGKVRETVFGLPVAGLPEGGTAAFGPDHLGPHPVARSGVAVDDRMRPLDAAGRVVLANVHVAGATLAGAEPWREKSGDGISIATGYRAAGAILGEPA